jgi:hypothetical protein
MHTKINNTIINILVCIFFCFSCNTFNSDKKFNKKQVLTFKNDSIEYTVFENSLKVNSDNISQCEKFLEINNSQNGFEIHGADIADLFSIFHNINKNNIDLRNRKAIFYSILYKGVVVDHVKTEIFQKLLDQRELKISKNSFKDSVNLLIDEDSIKIDQFLNRNNKDEIKVLLSNDKYILINVNLRILSNTLNELYPNKFFYNGENQKRYNLEIPLGKNEESIIIYLQEKYGIRIEKIQKEIQTYVIIDK